MLRSLRSLFLNSQLQSSKILCVEQCFSSKTDCTKSIAVARAPSLDVNYPETDTLEVEPDQEKSITIQAKPHKKLMDYRPTRLKPILKMEESELEGYALSCPKAPLLERRGEFGGIYKAIEIERTNQIDFLSVLQADIDLSLANLKRFKASLEYKALLKHQEYNEKRVRILGCDLAAAHFLVYRRGKVKFLGQEEWISTYRKDDPTGKADEVDLPVMSFEKCTLPTSYDSRFRVQALDFSGVPILFEGLANLEKLKYVKWLSFRDCQYFDDWCINRITCLFGDKLDYLDLSGCKRVTDRGIGCLVRCKNLKTLVVENMEHVKDFEIVCALLEDCRPQLKIIGVNYAQKIESIKKEEEELERKLREEAEQLEANTVTVEPRYDDVEKSNTSSK